jgi:hypothetical protein
MELNHAIARSYAKERDSEDCIVMLETAASNVCYEGRGHVRSSACEWITV